MTDEEFYDKEIAPELMRLSKLCVERGMPFVADVGFEGGKGSTRFVPEGCTDVTILFTWWASRARGNADTLIWAIQRHAREHGHNSACLRLMEMAGQ